MLLLMSNQEHDRPVIFLHGWCGHPEEASHIREAFPGRVLSPGWMPSPGSLDLEKWDPDRAAALMRSFADSILDQVARTIVDAGFAGAAADVDAACRGMYLISPGLTSSGFVLLTSHLPTSLPLLFASFSSVGELSSIKLAADLPVSKCRHFPSLPGPMSGV